MPDELNDAEDGLIDLSGLSLRDLDKFGESSLAFELRRVLDPDADVADVIAGFENTVPEL